jgi:sugar lactone lactonase YvrE
MSPRERAKLERQGYNMSNFFLKSVRSFDRFGFRHASASLLACLSLIRTVPAQTAPIIVTEPQSQNSLIGSNVTLSVAVAGSAAFPTVASGTLQLWLKADAGVVTNASGLVSQWQDQSGNTNDAAQANTNLQPTLVLADGLGGKPAIRFNGIQNNINGSYMHGTGTVNIPDAMTAFTVFKAISTTNEQDNMWLVGVPDVFGTDRGANIDAGYLNFTFWNYADFGNIFLVPTNTPLILTDRLNTNMDTLDMFDTSADSSTNYSLSVNGASPAGTGYYIGGLDSSVGPFVGSSRNFHGDFAELIFYKGYLTDADRLAVANYLEQKYQFIGVTTGASFQWQFDGTNIDGATNATLTLTDVQTNEAGSYSVIVSNLAGSTTSSNAVLATGYSPSITSQPQTDEVLLGTELSLTVDASGTGPLSYQWYFNGSILSQATNSTLSLPSVQLGNAGAYNVSVSSPFGLVFGTNFTLTVAGFSLGTTASLEGPSAGVDSVVLAAFPSTNSWTNTANAAWLHLSAPNQSGTGSTNVIFSFDANPGATRSGTLTIAGQTLTVTQAGSTYVSAGVLTTLVSPGSWQNGVAVDSAGDVYITDYADGTLAKWTAADNTLTTLASGLSGPEGEALDGAGNIYIADFGDSTIREWVVATSNMTTLVSSGLNGPESVALDALGNVYIADTFDNAIKEWTASSGTLTTLASTGLNQPNGVAVDVAGNVYIGDYNNSAIEEWIAADNILTNLVTGLNGTDGVAVDGAGNVYVANYSGSSIEKWAAASGAVSTLVSSGLNQPEKVTVDATGNIYIADTWNYAVEELPYAFVDPTPKSESPAAGSDTLPVVLPATENLLPPFAPTSDSSWLTISGITNGVVSFSFTASAAPRVGHISLLGQTIPVLQDVVLPGITSSPSNQTVNAGSTVTLSASATGSAPLSFQWLFDGTNISGATSASLILSNVLAANSGSYSMVAIDPYGSATSSVAILTVDETTIQIVSSNAVGGGTVVVSIDMNAVGTEAALGCTLQFDPSVLTFQGVVLGSGAAGGAPQPNTNQVASGILGLAVDMFGTFSPGTNDVFDITFQVAAVTNAPSTSTALTFANEPVQELVANAQAQTLPAIFVPGTLVIPPTVLAGDVSPRPNGNERVNIADWVQEGRFVAGLDIVSNGSEFQRADCAPRATQGDGQITVADWVQVGRYAWGWIH